MKAGDRMEYPKADYELSLAQQEDLIERLLVAAAELQTLSSDDSFHFNSLTGSVARLVHDWCVIVSLDVKEARVKAANDDHK